MDNQECVGGRDALIVHIIMFLFGALFAWGLTSRWDEVPPYSADWGNVADWAAAIGSFGAVVMALYNSNQAERREEGRRRIAELSDTKKTIARSVAIAEELYMFGGQLKMTIEAIKEARENKNCRIMIKDILTSHRKNPIPLLQMFVSDLPLYDVNEEASLLLVISGWSSVADPELFEGFAFDYTEDFADYLLETISGGMENLLVKVSAARYVTLKWASHSDHVVPPNDFFDE